jgi:putative spermidine/putrescine transport system permease protein
MTERAGLRNTLMMAPGVLTLAAFFVLPLCSVLVEAGHDRALARFFASADLLDALWRSVLLGVTAGLVALVVGVPVALHLARMPPRRRAVLQVLIALPLTFSGLIVAYGFILVLGRAGFVTLLLAELGADPATISGLLYGPFGLVLAYVYYLSPRVILLLLPVLVNFDTRQLQAAESLGAGRWRALADVLLPQLAPTLFSAFCLVSAVAVGTYGTALALVGTQINILPLRLYGMVSDAGADFPLAAATSLVLLVVCTLLMGISEVAAASREVRRARH